MTHPVVRAALAATLVVPLCAQENARVFDAAQVQLGPLQSAFEALFDLDGDPFPDAVGALFGSASGSIGVYRNDGTGRFVGVWVATVSTWFGNHVILPGDFDGDGRRDDIALATANLVGCYYFDGVGAPTVVGPQLAPPHGTLVDIAVADLDHDGKDDVLVLGADRQAVPQTFCVASFLSSTRGSFPVVHSTTATGLATGLRCVRRADGAHVAMVMGSGTALIRPFVVDPSGALLQAQTPLAVAPNLEDAAAGDLDGDGDEDFVRFGASNSTGQYQILRQAGSAFTVEPVLAGGPATALADVDGDGDLDGICCGGGGGGPPLPNQRASNFEIAIHDGNGGFAPSFRIAGLGARHIAGAADVDGDGDVDLVAGRVVYFADGPLNRSPFGATATTWFGSEGEIGGPFDGDGDGDRDLAVSPFGSKLNVGLRDFVVTPATSPIAWQYVQGMGFGDFDGDGDRDALVHVGAFNNPPIAPGVWNVVQVAPGRFALGNFAFAEATDRLVPASYWRCFDRDLDGDGVPDLVVTTDLPLGTSTSIDRASIYRGSASGAFTFVANLDRTVKAIADFDGDQRPDLLLARDFAGYSVARNQGAFTFGAPITIAAMQIQSRSDRTAIGDIDGDGDLDIAVPERSSTPATDTVRLIRNDGALTFVTLPRSPAFPDFGGAGQRTVALADADGDRVLDVLMYPGRGTTFGTTVLLGTGLGAYVERGTEIVAPDLASDLDGDGAADLVVWSGTQVIPSKARASGTRGGFWQRGASGPGSGGLSMSFGAKGPFRTDQTIELLVRGGPGGAIGALILGVAGADVPNAFGPGHNLYLDVNAPILGVPVTLSGDAGVPGAGNAAIHVAIPPTVLGVELHHQIGVVDPAAPLGVSTSNGLVIRYGS